MPNAECRMNDSRRILVFRHLAMSGQRPRATDAVLMEAIARTLRKADRRPMFPRIAV